MMNPKLSRIERALEALAPRERSCDLCPRFCRVDRTRDELGVCRTGSHAFLASALLHYGEEPVLSGTAGPPGRGSGTIFFAGCNLRCSFCQNYQISHLGLGREVTDEILAETMLRLQDQGAYNINLVSPGHVLLPILRALKLACGRGLAIPLVYNSNGYENAAVIERLAGIIDIYLPDLKYKSAQASSRFSGAADYFDRASAAVQEMFVQQPDLILDDEGLARRGLIIRHLVLPGQTADSIEIVEWIAAVLGPSAALSLMSQYHPCHEAPEELRRGLRPEEYRAVLDRVRRMSFENAFLQPEIFASDAHLLPDFERPDPFRWK